MAESDERHSTCPSGCSHCRQPLDPASDDAPAGARLVLSTVAAFLLPLVLATAGAVLAAGFGAVGQVLGAVAGLAVGVAAASGLLMVFRPRCRDSCPPGDGGEPPETP